MPSSLPDRLIRGSANAVTLEHLLIEPVEMTQPGERQQEEALAGANPAMQEQLQRILSVVRPKEESTPRQRG